MDKNGNYDGGAGGKFNGNHHYGGPDWKQKKEAVNSLYHAFSSVIAQKQAQAQEDISKLREAVKQAQQEYERQFLNFADPDYTQNLKNAVKQWVDASFQYETAVKQAQGSQAGNTSAQNVASKATQNGGKNGTITIERPQNEQDELKQFNFIGNQKTAVERLAAVNPHYNEGLEWQRNCQRCVIAEELQARGYNVTAKPFAKDNIESSGVVCWDIDWQNWAKDAGFVLVPGKSRFKSTIQDAFNKWGSDARVIVRVQWANKLGGRGHFFSAHMENGQIVYTDPQTNRIRDIDATLKDCTTSSKALWIMRVDNRALTPLVIDAVKNI